MSKIDLNKLKGEIDNRKKERNMSPSRLGETVGRGVAPRDSFLNGLLESLSTGRETASSVLVKTVDNTVSTRKGEPAKLPIRNSQPLQEPVPVAPHHTPNGVRRITEDDMSSRERDELLYAELERKRKQTLAESISQYTQPQYTQQPQYNGQTQQQYNPQTLNEGLLVESVKNIVNDYLTTNLGIILEEAIKSTILEMYATERIKEALTENKEMVKNVVFETIREIQQRNKQQKA